MNKIKKIFLFFFGIHALAAIGFYWLSILFNAVPLAAIPNSIIAVIYFCLFITCRGGPQ